MKLATTPEEQRQWMEQWRRAAIALDEVKRDELANLTEAKAWQQIDALCSLPDAWRDPNRVCGLIEQQAIFRRARNS